jgi:hypothetical protein
MPGRIFFVRNRQVRDQLPSHVGAIMATGRILLRLGRANLQHLELKRAHRHGPIAGVTGSGRTVTLQGIIGGLSGAFRNAAYRTSSRTRWTTRRAWRWLVPTAKTSEIFAAPRGGNRRHGLFVQRQNPLRFLDLPGERAARSAPPSAKWGR